MGTRLAAAAVRWAVDEAQQKFTASKWSQLISLTSIYAPSAAQGSLRGLARTAAGGLVDCRSAAWHSRAIASSVSDLAEERANRNRPNSRGNWDDGRPSSPHPQQQDRRRSWGDARPSGSRPQPQDRQQQNRPWQDRQHQDRPRTWGEGKPSFQRAQQPQQDRQQGQRPWQERQQDGHRPWVRPNSNPNGPRQQSDYRSRPHVNGQRPEYDRPQNFGNRNTSATGPGRDQRSSGWSPKYNGRQQQAGQRHNGDARKPFTYNGRNTKFGKSGAKGAVKAPAASDSVTVPVDVTVVRLAQILGTTVPQVEKVLTELGDPPRSEEDPLTPDTVELVALEFGKVAVMAAAPKKAKITAASSASLLPRPAVVAVMGHVDHGKTTLLDALRNTTVAAREAGGITQHVGAFEVTMPGSGASLTFLDTPGHAAFSAMRARGAAVTDLVVLVVAAGDGVMPQTREALAHARAAGCPIVVAITKCDLPNANPEKVRKQLLAEGLLLEGLGGNVQSVEVAAPANLGLAELEEALLLEGEMLELAADPHTAATATVVEARLDRGQGPVATVIVNSGTLKVGQSIVVGTECGKVRALKHPGGGDIPAGEGVTAGRPAELIGLKGVPLAGDGLLAVATDERAQRISKARKARAEEVRHSTLGRMSPEPGQVDDGPRVLPLVIKADVQGSAEAVRQSVDALSTDAVKVQVVHVGIGPVTKSDVALAAPFGAKVVGFNVRAAADVESEAKAQGVDVLCRRIIYELLDDVTALVEGAAPKQQQDVVIGSAEVLATFKVPGKKGAASRTVAGCRVGDGVLRSGLRVRVLRGGDVVHEAVCDSLRRHKLDVQTVGKGTECGLGLEDFDEFQPGDTLQCVELQ